MDTNKSAWADGFNAVPELVPALLASWRQIIAITMVGGLIAFALSTLQPVQYLAEAQLLLADPRNTGVFGESGVNFLDPSRYVRNQAEFAKSRTIMTRASEIIDGRLSPNAVSDQITIRPSSDLDLLLIRAADGTAAGAAQLANSIGEAYEIIVREQSSQQTQASLAELQAQRQQLQASIAEAEQGLQATPNDTSIRAERDAAVQQLITIDSRADQISVDSTLFGSGVELFERAEPPRAPSAPTPVRNAVLGAMLGAMLAAAIAWWRADETATAEGRNDPQRALRAPLLGTVPSFAEVGVTSNVPTVDAPKSPAGEAYQFLVGALAFALAESSGKSVVMTSASPADGKSVTSLNMAIAAAQDGRDVILVDADTRVRGLTRRTGAKVTDGLPGLADPDRKITDVVVPLEFDDKQYLPFIPARPLGDDTAAFFRTPGFRKSLARLTEVADLVVIDSPPLLLASDASAIATNVDGIVVVVSRGTPMRLLEEVRERLDRIGTPVLGYVYTKARIGGAGYGDYAYRYGYSYAYGYGETPEDRGQQTPNTRRGRKAGKKAKDAELVR